MYRRKHLLEAIALSRECLETGQGGPFGCVIARGDEIVGRGRNMVTARNDPTAHAEIEAIRDACRKLGTFDLSACQLYTSCEPCPMCLGAVYWARLDRIYMAAARHDAADAGFDDSFIYDEIALPLERRSIPVEHHERAAAVKVFQDWVAWEDRRAY